MASKWSDYPAPEVGQVWTTMDKSNQAGPRRIVAIEGGRVVFSGYPRSCVRVPRMKPTSNGYRLLRTADGKPYNTPGG